MEAPKEIYILTTKTPNGGFGISYHLHQIETKKTESIKYIRADIAEHFYNLALEEVRTLILKRLEMHDKDREDFAWMWAEDKRILKEIDNLTK